MEKMRFIAFTLLLLSSTFVLATCGGGGGDSGGGGGIVYTGLTTQAAISNANAENLAAGAYAGGAFGSAFAGMATVQKSVVDRPRYLNLSLTMKKAILQVDVHTPPGNVAAGATVTRSGSFPGDCAVPGTASYTIQADTVTGAFSGNMSFSGYCVQGETINGTASFSGTADVGTGNILVFSLSFTNLTATSGSDSVAFSGSLTYNCQSSPTTAAMELLLRDNIAGKVYWENNITMTLWEVSG
jgi:hypothetical protein